MVGSLVTNLVVLLHWPPLQVGYELFGGVLGNDLNFTSRFVKSMFVGHKNALIADRMAERLIKEKGPTQSRQLER